MLNNYPQNWVRKEDVSFTILWPTGAFMETTHISSLSIYALIILIEE
jgi:hypothetical protein